jgi:hypothetical protein
MSRLSKLVMPSVLVGLLSCCVLAKAEAPAPPKGATTGVEAKAGAPLTDESLGQMLRGLGYEPEVVNTLEDGRKVYRIHMKQDGWTFHFTILLSPDRSVLWVESYLGNVPAGDKIQAEAVLKLLKLNADSTGKGKFVVTAHGELWLWMPQDNIGITPSLLRSHLELTGRIVKDTMSHWKTGRWTAEGKEAMAFQTRVETLYGKVREAYQEFYRELNPIFEGRAVDRDRLKKAHAKLLRTVREVRDSLKGMETPDSPAAREMLDGYLRVLEAEEASISTEMADIMRIVEDGKLSASDRVAKIRGLIDQMVKKEEGVFKALQVAYASFRKHYGEI